MDLISIRENLIPFKSSDTDVDVAHELFTHILKQQGMPDDIVSYLDLKFTSKFWNTLVEVCCVRLKMSSIRHPKKDEVMNRIVENCRR